MSDDGWLGTPSLEVFQRYSRSFSISLHLNTESVQGTIERIVSSPHGVIIICRVCVWQRAGELTPLSEGFVGDPFGLQPSDTKDCFQFEYSNPPYRGLELPKRGTKRPNPYLMITRQTLGPTMCCYAVERNLSGNERTCVLQRFMDDLR